ncbi:MAG: hypothetical protein RRY20_03035, partial [Bilophila sp.]
PVCSPKKRIAQDPALDESRTYGVALLERFQNENALLTRKWQPPQRGVDFGEKPTRRVPRRGIAVGECNEPYGYREQRDVFPQNANFETCSVSKLICS